MKARRIRWQYTHHLNYKSTVERMKVGEYFGKVKHTERHWRKPDADQMAVVLFDDNKRVSHVPYDELQFVKAVDKQKEKP